MQERKPAREQEPEQEQEHDPSKVAVELKIPPNNKHSTPFDVRGKGLVCCMGDQDFLFAALIPSNVRKPASIKPPPNTSYSALESSNPRAHCGTQGRL